MFSSSDIFFMNDGGRAGNKNQLCNLRRDDQPVQKAERTLTIIYDEESLMKRKVSWPTLNFEQCLLKLFDCTAFVFLI